MSVWVLQYDCGDYYCDSDHVVGVFTTEELANQGWTAYEEASPKHLLTWVPSVTEWTLDEVLDGVY